MCRLLNEYDINEKNAENKTQRITAGEEFNKN